MKTVLITLPFLCAPLWAAEIDPKALADLRADIVILGEVHDNPAHHAHQAAAVAALAPQAVVFEMLTPDQAARVTPDLRADPVALGKALEWETSGWPDFALYAPIFAAAPQARVVGAALPREQLRHAVADGAASVFGARAQDYGLDQPLAPADQAARLDEQRIAHCNALPEDLLPGMVQAQRLRDAAFADAAIAALRDSGGPVVIITGSGHARVDHGVPAMIRRAAPGVSVVSVGQLERPVTDDPPPFDHWIITDPAERPDPCAALR